MSKHREVWRVVRCAYYRRNSAMEALRDDGFTIHDSYLATGGNEWEEFTIIAKKVPANDAA
jgi:hypothetical protein